MFDNLEAITSAYIDASEQETEAMLLQGEIIVQAEADGFSAPEVIRHLASQVRRTARTIQRRYKTSQVFTRDNYNPQLPWELHALCAETDKPHEWLAIAADGNLSTRELKLAIKAAGEGVPDEPVFVYNAAPCGMYPNHDGTLTIELGGAGYVLTLVKLAENEGAFASYIPNSSTES